MESWASVASVHGRWNMSQAAAARTDWIRDIWLAGSTIKTTLHLLVSEVPVALFEVQSFELVNSFV